MTTWPEARAARAERLRRTRRLYTPDRRGPLCPVCRTPTVKGLAKVHPVCAEPDLMALGPGEHVHRFVPTPDGELYGKPRYRNRCADPTCNVRQLETLTERQPA